MIAICKPAIASNTREGHFLQDGFHFPMGLASLSSFIPSRNGRMLSATCLPNWIRDTQKRVFRFLNNICVEITFWINRFQIIRCSSAPHKKSCVSFDCLQGERRRCRHCDCCGTFWPELQHIWILAYHYYLAVFIMTRQNQCLIVCHCIWPWCT